MVQVGHFKVDYDNNSDVQVSFALSGTKIVWPGGSPPKDSPKCGFDNEKCPPPKPTNGESGKTISYGCMSAYDWSMGTRVSWCGVLVFNYLRRLERLTIFRCHCKGSTFSSVTYDPECWSGLGLEPETSRTVVRRSPK